MKKGIVKKGQIWADKATGRRIQVVGKATGNFHWLIVHLTKHQKGARHLHEGTIQKLYTLLQ